MSYKKAIVFGHGRIGSELVRLLKRVEGLEEITILSRKLFLTWKQLDDVWYWDGPNAREDALPQCFADTIVFVAIPTTDNGLTARNIILHYALRGVRVVTCEKGVLANHFDALEGELDRIHFSAALGGMAQVVPFIQSRIPSPSVHVRAVLNASLNVLFGWFKSSPSLLSHEAQLKQAHQSLVENHLAEPPSSKDKTFNLVHVINREIEDAARKAIMLANFCYLRKGDLPVKRKRITVRQLQMRDFVGVRDRGDRFIVEYCSGDAIDDSERAHFTRVAFRFTVSGVRCRGGFVHASEFEGFELPKHEAYCAVSIRDFRFGLPQVIMGPGAGVTETALTMLNDAGIEVVYA